MNSTNRAQLCLLSGLTTLVLALGACSEGAKTETSKVSQSGGAATKSGPGQAMVAAVFASALADQNVTKSTSSIEPGDAVAGLLRSGDNQLDDGSYYDAWLFELGSTTEAEISMNSTELDPYLSLYAGHPGRLGTLIGSDDDSGGMSNALVRVELPAGAYTIVANSFGPGETGAYELSFADGGAGDSGSNASTVLHSGSTASGSLETSDLPLGDGSYYDERTYWGESGERLTITMTSDVLDSFLLVYQGSSVAAGEFLDEDDDGGGDLDAQITLILPASGTYTFAANTYGGGETGSYQLSVESGGSDAMTYTTGGSPDGKYALLVGIDNYPGTGSDLSGPVEDARIMHRALTERFGFDPADIVVLNDSDATRENIANGIVQHLGQAGEEGVAVFFYSGHGMQMGQNLGLTGSLDPEPRGDGDEAIYIYGYSDESSVLLDEELGFLIETIDAGRALVVVDACFSGEITRGASDAPQSKIVDINDPEIVASLRLPTNFIGAEMKVAAELADLSLMFGDLESIERAFQQPQRHIMWGASTEDQVSWTSGLGNNASVFTYYVGEHLMSAPLDATFGDLSGPVHDDVMAYIRDSDLTDQNPQMRGDNASMTLGEFFGTQ